VKEKPDNFPKKENATIERRPQGLASVDTFLKLTWMCRASRIGDIGRMPD